MGGHAAWRKRLKNGDLAKGSGGAICRHRPHFNRGKPILKKGQLRGGNPKKRGKKDKDVDGDDGVVDEDNHESHQEYNLLFRAVILVANIVILVVIISIFKYVGISNYTSIELSNPITYIKSLILKF